MPQWDGDCQNPACDAVARLLLDGISLVAARGGLGLFATAKETTGGDRREPVL